MYKRQGEGGVVVTDNDDLAEKVRLIRNHAEAVVEDKGVTDLTNMIGFNFRMNEIEATITREQLKKLPSLVKQRQENVSYLASRLSTIPCIEPAKVRPCLLYTSRGIAHAHEISRISRISHLAR